MNPAAANTMLSSKERTALRARAHALKPVVWIAESGITPGVMREIDRALAAHELIKIHAAISGRAARDALLGDICVALGAQPVQVIGKMLVAFRHRPEPAQTPDAHAKAKSNLPNRGRRTPKARPKAKPIRRDR